MEQIKAVRVRTPLGGVLSDEIPIGVDAKNVLIPSENCNLEKTLGEVDVNERGSVGAQLKLLRSQIEIFMPAIDISSISCTPKAEYKKKEVKSITLKWKCNKTPKELFLNNEKIDNTLTSKDIEGPFQTDTFFSLRATDPDKKDANGNPIETTKSTGLYFYFPYFYGTISKSNVSFFSTEENSEIEEFIKKNNKGYFNRVNTTVNIPTGGESMLLWVAFPAQNNNIPTFYLDGSTFAGGMQVIKSGENKKIVPFSSYDNQGYNILISDQEFRNSGSGVPVKMMWS